jgi:hypothetical protein
LTRGAERGIKGHIRLERTLSVLRRFWAINSAGECYLHTVEVTGSNPVSPMQTVQVQRAIGPLESQGAFLFEERTTEQGRRHTRS